MQALIMAALLAAIVSTASFFISLASGAITRDLAGAMGHEIAHDRQIVVGRYFAGRRDDSLYRLWLLGRPGGGHFGNPRLGLLRICDDPHLRDGPSLEALLAGRHCRGVDLCRYLQHRVPLLENFKIWRFPFPYYLFTIGGTIILTTVISFFTDGAAGKNLPKQMEPVFKL